jgi:hypothetical protein
MATKGRGIARIPFASENCACSAPPACLATDRISAGRETWAASAIRSLALAPSRWPGHVFPFGWCAVFAIHVEWFPCNLRRGGRAPEPPLFPERRYAVSGTGKCRNADAAHRAPYAASLRRQRLPKWNLRNRPCYHSQSLAALPCNTEKCSLLAK